MGTLWQDLRFALRTLAKDAGFTVVAVLILALGMGATTAVFSVVNAVLLRPLPYQDPSRLVAMSSVFEPGKSNRDISVVPLTDVEEWRKHVRSLESMGAFAYTQLPIRVGEQAFFPVTALMDPEFLPTLGNTLAIGTPFASRSETGGEDRTVIISHRLWLDAFGGAPDAVGRRVTVDGSPFTVRGILPAEFQFPRADAAYSTNPVDMLMPAAVFLNFPASARQWFGIARLAPGATLAQAETELRTVIRGIGESVPEKKNWSARLTPLAEATARSSRTALLITLGISVVLLLIAATNLMNLLFSRGAARLREMAIRKAIGGTTFRLVRQFLTESLCLAVLGAAAGIGIAVFAIDVLVALSPVHLPVTQQIRIDGAVLAFTFAVSAGAALIAGLFPALHVSVKCEEAVRSPGARATAGRALSRVQQGLCITQMALGVALLAAAGLLTHSLWRLNDVDPGYRSADVFGFSLSYPSDDSLPIMQSLEKRKMFYQAALDEIRHIPGVISAGWITFLPPETRSGVFMGLTLEASAAPPAEPRVANHLISSPDYFATMGMRLAAGRDFSSSDLATGPPVIIINEALARRYFPGAAALGKKIGTPFDGNKPVREIVGIVADTHDRGVAANAIPTLYIPFQQFALPYGSIAVRAAVPAAGIIPEIRRRLATLDAGVPLTNFETVAGRLRQSLDEPRFYTTMAASCAFMAVLFVSLGLYGIISYSVSRRTAEFGVRMAVGAGGMTILRMVLGQGLRMAAIGVTLGVAISFAAGRVLASLLFQVKPVDPVTLVPAALVVVLVTVLASYVPARRASRVSPIVALRYE
jgi:putative ABC transport system permease protein